MNKNKLASKIARKIAGKKMATLYTGDNAVFVTDKKGNHYTVFVHKKEETE